ncbi:MAG: glycosyltransferase [Patescibacteria group bacterium]|nr:glycosyltransferase [Patescibacteria group bacterium]MDE2437841.1 glycosyltransferase [Patescibacteria group bacterium]
MKVAILHDYLNQLGGAERVLHELTSLFPEAPIFTLLYDEERTHGEFHNKTIHTSFLQHVPGGTRRHHYMIPLMPLAAQAFFIRDFDLILSDSSGFAKGFAADPRILHINYCYTPLRYAWEEKYLETYPWFRALHYGVTPLRTFLKAWDLKTSRAPHVMYTISNHIARKIKRYYGRDTRIIYPPVRTDFFYSTRAKETTYCAVGRLLHYKRFDLVVDTFNMLGLPLKIIGVGPEYRALKARANHNIEFLGHVSDETLRDCYSASRALIFPHEEDFGLVPVEALGCGTPVVAFARGGGPTEIITPGYNGVFFEEQTKESLADAIHKLDTYHITHAACRESALPFSRDVFRNTLRTNIEQEFLRHYAAMDRDNQS